MQTIKTTFNAGKLSAYLDGRVDISKYYNGCSQLVNAIPLSTGGITKRPGTRFIAKAKGPCRLIPFEFSADDTLVLEFSDLAVRFYKNCDRVMLPSTAISSITLLPDTEVAVDTTEAHGLQTGDVVRFADVLGTDELNYAGNFATEWTITKTSSTAFTLDGTNGSNFSEYKGGGTVAGIYSIASPYTLDDVWQLHYTQSGDVLYLTHPDYPPYTLSRYGDASWVIQEANLVGGPFLGENTTDTYLLGFTRTGGIARCGHYFPAGAIGTLTASGTGNAPFLPQHVGSLWMLKHTRPDNTMSTPDNTTNAVPTGTGIKIKGSFSFDVTVNSNTFKIWRRQGNGAWQEYRTFLANTAYTSDELDDDVYYTFTSSSSSGSAVLTAKDQTNVGIVKITGYISPTSVSATVIQPVLSNNSDDSAVTTSMWAEGAFNAYRGYPRTLVIHENRLWFASTSNNPQTLWGSSSSRFLNFTAGDTDSDAVTVTIEDSDVSNIQWMASDEYLVVGTANKEYKISASNIDDPITPDDVRCRVQSALGSNSMQPVHLNNTLFYFQGGGRTLRSMRLMDATMRYESDNATLLVDDIFDSLPVQIAVQRVPYAILWIVRQDGALVSFTYEPKEEVSAWSEHVTGGLLLTPYQGQFSSVCVIRGMPEDEVYVCVRRIIGGIEQYYIEQFAARYTGRQDTQSFLDCSTVFTANSQPVNIVYASDTVLYGFGNYGSGRYGGTV